MGTKLIYSTEQIIQALKDTNGLISLAAKCLGCVPQTIYNRAARTQSIRQAIKNSRNELVDFAELALRSSVIAQESWAVQFTLKTLGKDRGYVERHELTGEDGKPISIQTVGFDTNKV